MRTLNFQDIITFPLKNTVRVSKFCVSDYPYFERREPTNFS